MPEEKEIRDRILAKAEEFFLQYGYTKVTMDEIAASLGMSKKTLYKFYPGKEKLLLAVVENLKCGIDNCLNYIVVDESMDFVEKLKEFMSFIASSFGKLRGPLLEDLEKNIPEIWIKIDELRRIGIMNKFEQLLTEGVKRGVFREDISLQVATLMYLHSMKGIINPAVLSQMPFTAEQLFDNIIKILYEGMLTEEGRKKYNSKKSND